MICRISIIWSFFTISLLAREGFYLLRVGAGNNGKKQMPICNELDRDSNFASIRKDAEKAISKKTTVFVILMSDAVLKPKKAIEY